MPSMEISHFHLDNCTVNGTYPHNGTYVRYEQCQGCTLDGNSSMVPVGIIVGLLSSIFINLGQNIQSIGANEECTQGGTKPCNSKTWIIGLTIFIFGSFGNMVAMAFASATILVPLESSQFVTNVLFSKFVKKTDITPRQWTGTFLSVLGTVSICVFGPNDERCFLMSDLIGFWASPIWIVYLIVTVSLSFVGWYFYGRMLKQCREGKRPAIADTALPTLFALSSALIGGAQMIVHSKALAELFDMVAADTIPGGFVGLISHWFFWLELMITAVCGTFWAIQMNGGLTLYDPLFIIPLLQASYILFGSTGSGIFYQEFGTLASNGMVGAWAWLFFVGGICLVIFGIMLLAPPESLAAFCACLGPRSARPLTKSIEVQRAGHTGLGALSLPDYDGPTMAQASSKGRATSGLELVQGMPGLSSPLSMRKTRGDSAAPTYSKHSVSKGVEKYDTLKEGNSNGGSGRGSHATDLKHAQV